MPLTALLPSSHYSPTGKAHPQKGNGSPPYPEHLRLHDIDVAFYGTASGRRASMEAKATPSV